MEHFLTNYCRDELNCKYLTHIEFSDKVEVLCINYNTNKEVKHTISSIKLCLYMYEKTLLY